MKALEKCGARRVKKKTETTALIVVQEGEATRRRRGQGEAGGGRRGQGERAERGRRRGWRRND